MSNSTASQIAGASRRRPLTALTSALLCLAFAGCSIRGTAFNDNIVRDNGKVYSYKRGVVRCDDGRKIPYHPNDFEKDVGFSLPAICGYH